MHLRMSWKKMFVVPEARVETGLATAVFLQTSSAEYTTLHDH